VEPRSTDIYLEVAVVVRGARPFRKTAVIPPVSAMSRVATLTAAK